MKWRLLDFLSVIRVRPGDLYRNPRDFCCYLRHLWCLSTWFLRPQFNSFRDPLIRVDQCAAISLWRDRSAGPWASHT